MSYAEEKSAKEIIESQRVRLEAAAKLAAIGEMSASVAHEVNNPLGIVAGLAELLLNSVDGGEEIKSEKLKMSLQKILVGCDRISKIVRGLKFLAHSGAEEPLAAIQLSTVVDSVLDACGEKFKANGVSVSVEIERNLSFQGRASQIVQILINLLNNSFDAVQNLENKWIKIEAHTTLSRVLISISDSGLPIAPEVRKKLMRSFFTTKELGVGTGLGLNISRKIAEAHGGTLYFDETSEVTRFVLDLPSGCSSLD